MFVYCQFLTSITIPDNVMAIGNRAFMHCASLTNIKVSSGNTAYADIDGVLFNKALTELLAFPRGRGVSYSIPNSVTTIGDGAFDISLLTNITIPDSVTTIGNSAFSENQSLTSIIIPDSVTIVGDGAFWNCFSLTSVTLSSNITEIGNWAFGNCRSLISINSSDRITTIGESAFADTNLSESVKQRILQINPLAFDGEE